MQNRIKQIVIAILILYLFWFKETFFSIDYLLYGLCGVLLLFVLFEKKFQYIPLFGAWLGFLIYAFVFGVLLSTNLPSFFFSIVKLFVYLLICVDVYEISLACKSTGWIQTILIAVACVCALQCLVKGHHFNGGDAITMSQMNNPNFLATVELAGVIAVLNKTRKKRIWTIFSVLFAGLFAFTIVRTGSRKVFYSLIILIVLWIIFFERRLFKKNLKQFALFNLMVFAFAIFGIIKVIPMLDNSLLFTKIFAQEAAVSDRLELYREAYDIWLEHPLFGVGLNQFSEYCSTGRYSHSTYAEVLACTGIVGSVLFFIPLLKNLKDVFVRIIREKNADNQYKYCLIFCTFFIVCILGIGQIWIYEVEHLLLISMSLSNFSLIQKSDMRRPVSRGNFASSII